MRLSLARPDHRSSAVRSVCFALALAGFGLLGAAPPQTPASSPTANADANAKQEAQVRAACSGCHLVPSPEILPRSEWRSVVFDMAGLSLQGIGGPRDGPPLSPDFDAEQILHFYENRAPQTLASPPPWPPPGRDPGRFVRRALRFGDATAPAAVAHVRFLRLTAGDPLQIVAADMVSGLILAGSPRKPEGPLRLVGRVPNPVHVEAVDLDQDGRTDLLVANLGGPRPGDHLRGTVTWLRRLSSGDFETVSLASGLPRVADVQAADFDGDGDLDLVVAAFGWRAVGGVLLLENQTKDWAHPVFAPRELDDRAGAIHVPVVDLDGDRHLDFVALVSQQHEAVVAFLGDGLGAFRKQTLDRAPHPAWGSSGLQLVDLDKDGDLDALVTNGDMLDDFQLKPYHGIRWLENRGGVPFVAHDLAPLFGVLRAQAADLDGDGDLDVVACALVPPSKVPGERSHLPSLVWLEQKAAGHFEPHTLEIGSQHLSLDLADFDGDGDMDLAVANSLSGGDGHVTVWENVGIVSRR